MMKLSVVIPMFNAAEFITKCLDSCSCVPDGTVKPEVIVINDGSTDQSEEIVRNYALSHDNVKLFSQPNARQGAARNKGLSKAGGDYVWFVDADDSIMPGMMEAILEILDKEAGQGLDILAFGMKNVDAESGTVESVFRYDSEFVGSGREFLVKMDEKLKLCPPLYIYRRDYLNDNNLNFIPGVLHEDVDFIPRSVYFADRIKITALTPYARLVHSGSVTNTSDTRRIHDMLTVIDKLWNFAGKQAADKKSYRALCSIISNAANYACRIAGAMGKEVEKQYNEAICKGDWLKSALLSSTKMKYRVEGILLALMPGRFATIHDFLMRFK